MAPPAEGTSPGAELRGLLGEIDVYLFDQLLKGRFDGRRRVLDAGCGGGRNLVYLLRRGFECHGLDRDPAAVARVQALAAELAPALPASNFRAGELDRLPWEDGCMDAVICSAVLHFASDGGHFERMLGELWRVLAPGGLLFARLASRTGLEDRVRPIGGGRALLPDGSARFLVSEEELLRWTEDLGGRLLEPVKTTNVQHLRCMSTWCLEKPA